MTVGDANISVSVNNPGSGYKVGEQITILGSQLGATDGVDNIVVNGNAANVSVSATGGSGYTAGGTVTLNWIRSRGGRWKSRDKNIKNTSRNR